LLFTSVNERALAYKPAPVFFSTVVPAQAGIQAQHPYSMPRRNPFNVQVENVLMCPNRLSGHCTLR
jgi:hypothetical protein